MYKNVKPLTKEEREMYMWKCPICGDLYEECQESLDHIIKLHLQEYRNTFCGEPPASVS